MQTSKVYIMQAGSYDLFGNGIPSICAVGEVWECYSSMAAVHIQAGAMRFATSQEITDAMAAGKAH